MTLEERVSLLEFQVELLLRDTSISRYLVETKITREQYHGIADLLDVIRHRLDNGEEVHHAEFEREIYKIVPEQNGNHEFCELLTELLGENGRWTEAFPALYGNETKYCGI